MLHVNIFQICDEKSAVRMASFTFVEYEGPNLSNDPAVRRRARQQAMRDVAIARRKKGNYGKHNLRQEPPPCLTSMSCVDEIKAANSLQAPIAPLHGLPSKHLTQPTDIELGQIDLDTLERFMKVACTPPRQLAKMSLTQSSFELLQKVPMTGLRLGITPVLHQYWLAAANGDVLAEPQVGSKRFLSYIPSRYGQVPCLTLAVDCVLAKMRHMISASSSSDSVTLDVILGSYNKALRAVQLALNDSGTRMNAETLCATVLLGIFEFLNDGETVQHWMHHVGGAARLIEARGVERFHTDFELSLFLENIGSTVTAAFLNNTACFLNEEKWLNLIQQAILSDKAFDTQNDLMSMLWSALTIAPRFFRDTTRIIVPAQAQPVSQEDIDGLIKELSTARNHLIQWLSLAERDAMFRCDGLEWCGEGAAVRWPLLTSDNHDSSCNVQLAMYGTYAMCRIFKARLLYALDPARFHSLENECQELASRIMDMDNQFKDDQSSYVWSLFKSQSSWIAKGIIETKDMWRRDNHHGSKTIEKWKFEAWCSAIGRKIN